MAYNMIIINIQHHTLIEYAINSPAFGFGLSVEYNEPLVTYQTLYINKMQNTDPQNGSLYTFSRIATTLPVISIDELADGIYYIIEG